MQGWFPAPGALQSLLADRSGDIPLQVVGDDLCITRTLRCFHAGISGHALCGCSCIGISGFIGFRFFLVSQGIFNSFPSNSGAIMFLAIMDVIRQISLSLKIGRSALHTSSAFLNCIVATSASARMTTPLRNSIAVRGLPNRLKIKGKSVIS